MPESLYSTSCWGAWDEKPGLPKALVPARKNLEHLIRKQHVYGDMVFFNINICRNNHDDVRQITEYARLATDYHIQRNTDARAG